MRAVYRCCRPVAAFALGLSFGPGPVQAQRPMDHEVWDIWKRLQGQQVAADGHWVLYNLNVLDGDTELHVRRLGSEQEYVIPRGAGARFSRDSRFVVFLIKPADSAVKSKRRDHTPAARMPRDSLGMLDLLNGTVTREPRVVSYQLPKDGTGWLAYRHAPPVPSADSGSGEGKKKKDEDRVPDVGTELVLHDLATGTARAFPDVVGYRFADGGERLAFATAPTDSAEAGVYVFDVEAASPRAVLLGAGHYRGLAFSRDANQLAFLTDRDQADADQPAFALYRWRVGDEQAVRVADAGTDGLPAGWWVSEHGEPSFSPDGTRLFFGTAPRPEPDPEDLPEWEQVKVDVWNWRDPLLQPMQLVQRDDELKRTYRAVAFDDGRVVQLADPGVPTVEIARKGDGDVALGATNVPYRQEISWDSPRYYDVYVVDVTTGRRRLVVERLQSSPQLSPEGRYLAWWDGDRRAWFALSTDGETPVNISGGVRERLDNELHDWPFRPNSYGAAGWTTDDHDLLVYDRFDIWALDPAGQRAPRNVTERVGRRDHLRFRHVDLDPDDPVISTGDPLLLSAFDTDTKAAGFYQDRVDGRRAPRRLIMADRRFRGVRKARDAEVVVYTRESFREFPDLWASDLEFADPHRVSDANPQQAAYRWGDARLVHWRSTDGRPHDGLLFTPDGFDPGRQYPMMVYFYEKNSDGLFTHRAPFVGGSSINITFYVSRGYVVFVPDVHYQVGYPGPSAVSSVVSGVLHVLDQGFVDPSRVGVQGHSWGGYQIAYMVTRTNIFAAAEAGAPVANMTSAYGGIRWGSGMSRMFQYEKTQSRIGGTLWEVRDRYIDNSPLFRADRVHTPLLMMHNDHDTAVPWYQGIELFVALRRLHRPAWMLNYNGEPHGLRKAQNRKDWQIRMQQFFDHYLQGAPEPVWMAEGVPAVAKGRDSGLEFRPVTEAGGGHGHR